jgi:hypothetical protein
VTAIGGTISPQNPTVQLIAFSVLTNLIYHWTGPNGFESWVRNPIVSVVGTYTLTVTNIQTGCMTTVSVVVN